MKLRLAIVAALAALMTRLSFSAFSVNALQQACGGFMGQKNACSDPLS